MEKELAMDKELAAVIAAVMETNIVWILVDVYNVWYH